MCCFWIGGSFALYVAAYFEIYYILNTIIFKSNLFSLTHYYSWTLQTPIYNAITKPYQDFFLF